MDFDCLLTCRPPRGKQSCVYGDTPSPNGVNPITLLFSVIFCVNIKPTIVGGEVSISIVKCCNIG